MKNILKLTCLLIAIIMLLPSCAPNNVDVFTGDHTNAEDYYPSDIENESSSEQSSEAVSETYETNDGKAVENPFVDVKENATSRVVATSGTASYRHFCDLADSGYTLSELKKCSYSFKSEEFLNFLSLPAQDGFGDGVFKKSVKISKCLWNSNNYFLKITLQAGESTRTEKNNIVFYIDVSESMWDSKMLPVIIDNADAFTGKIQDNDTVSIVTSSPQSSVLLDSVSGDNTDTIIEAFKNINAQDAANNHDSLEQAYKLAEKNLIDGGANRVVLISDGDISDGYGKLIEEYAQKGIELKVIGLGAGNYKNEKLLKIAALGGGEYIYVDGEAQAKDFLKNGIFKKTQNTAQDLVANISFCENTVTKYRLIGYKSENMGEGAHQNQPQIIRAGDIITLCYELELAEGIVSEKDKIADVNISYKSCETQSKVSTGFEIEFTHIEDDSEMTLLMCCVQTLMVLKDSPYAKNIKLSDVYKLLESIEGEQYGKAEEFTYILGIITGKIKK